VTRYELLDRIGVGGMAEIFRGKAVAAGGFEKPVAIKRILPHLSQDRRFVELLIAEAKVLSLLKHRNIVQIFDVGLGDDGKYFLVMEYVDGKDLGAVQRGLEVRRRRMPFDLALHIGAEICEALEHAHGAKAPDGRSMSLVHRDVSPSNVLLSRAGEVKLTDFGIAKRAEQEATGHGAVRGKFAYISPEQARNEHIDPRSDVFSVGILLWELITNRRLFSGLGALEALRAVREAQVPRPSEIDPRVHPEIDQLLLSAMARDVSLRPTAGQFGAKLRSLRYSLDVTVGDPATELAKIIDTADEVERQSQNMLAQQLPHRPGSTFDEHTEATVIRIRTADEFQARDKDGADVAKARQVIDRFEEEETRQAQLSGDQLRILRAGRRDSSGPAAAPGQGPLPGMTRARRPTDEPTVAREPLTLDEQATIASDDLEDLVNQPYDSDESTRLVAPRDRRTPAPQRTVPSSAAPAMPPRSRGPTPGPPPGTVHQRMPAPPQQHVRPGAPSSGAPGSGAPSSGAIAPISASARVLPMPAPLPTGPGSGGMPHAYMQPPPPPAPPPPMLRPPAAGTHGSGGANNYGTWGVQSQLPPRGASPTAPEMYDNRPGYPPAQPAPQRPSVPSVAGFGRPKAPTLKPWMLIVGALLMAVLAFAITRAFLS
jgi:serine/threonine-protein kinase